MDIAGAVFASLLPNAGFIATEWASQKVFSHIWLQDLNHPPWATDGFRTAMIPTWAAANFMLGRTSYAVLASRRKSWLPMTFYASLLFLFWIHYPVYLGTRSLKCGLVAVVLAMVAAVTTFVLFSKISPLTFPLMPLFMVLLAHECYYSYWLLKYNSPEIEIPDHTGEGEATSGPAVPPVSKDV